VSQIDIVGLGKSFGQTPVLTDITLTVPAGSRTVVVGASGSGKTTLLRLLGGFEVPDAGSIRIGDRTVAGVGVHVPAHERGVGYVSQDGSLFPHLSVGANVGFGLSGRPGEKTIAELLEMVSLDADLASRRPDQLSGGQQQRVALARALARKPQVMLLDEPFSSLDAGLRAATRDSVAELLAAEGVTTVLVTHDQAEALSFAHQLAVIREGRLAQVGTPRELYARPADVRTSLFLGDAVLLRGVVSGTSTALSAECALGRVPIGNPFAGGDATIMLRPEQLAVEPDALEGTGVVESASFFGAAVMLSIRIAPGTTAEAVIRLPHRSLDNPDVGSRVRITLSGTALAFPPTP
jgi:iron(III) transport system ATP-binding protein